MVEGKHCGVQARVREETKKWFLSWTAGLPKRNQRDWIAVA